MNAGAAHARAEASAASDLAAQRFFLDPSGRRRSRTFDFTQGEIDVATALVNGSAARGTTLDMSRSASTRDGLVRLLDRGLITVAPGDPAALPAHHVLDTDTAPPQPVATTWATVDAEATAIRHLARHYSHGNLAQSVILNRVVRSTTGAFTDAEIALITAWHYRHTDVHSITITHTPIDPHDLHAATKSGIVVTELRYGQPDFSFPVPPPNGTPVSLDVTATDDYQDKGETLHADVFDHFVRALAGRYQAARVDFDTLRVLPVGYRPGTWDQTLPALTHDALAFHGAPTFESPQEFFDWVNDRLIITLPCGQVRHRMRLDPTTHTTRPHPNTQVVQERHDAEHMLLAFTAIPVDQGGTGIGCQNAAAALDMFGEMSQYATQGWGPQQVSALSAARTLARTAQYLHTGVDPKQARQFLRLGLRADQAANLVRLQAEDPDGVKALLLWWTKYHWQHGPTNVAQIPTMPGIPFIEDLVDDLTADDCDYLDGE